jgi:hypothetical protein
MHGDSLLQLEGLQEEVGHKSQGIWDVSLNSANGNTVRGSA